MRYRRYITHKNPDGSKTVVSVGPVADYALGWLTVFKWLVVLLFIIAFLFWPPLLISGHLRGAGEWVAGVLAELGWLAVLVLGSLAYKTKAKPTIPKAGPELDSAVVQVMNESTRKLQALTKMLNKARTSGVPPKQAEAMVSLSRQARDLSARIRMSGSSPEMLAEMRALNRGLSDFRRSIRWHRLAVLLDRRSRSATR
jgi:hypothetical protein